MTHHTDHAAECAECGEVNARERERLEGRVVLAERRANALQIALEAAQNQNTIQGGELGEALRKLHEITGDLRQWLRAYYDDTGHWQAIYDLWNKHHMGCLHLDAIGKDGGWACKDCGEKV